MYLIIAILVSKLTIRKKLNGFNLFSIKHFASDCKSFETELFILKYHICYLNKPLITCILFTNLIFYVKFYRFSYL